MKSIYLALIAIAITASSCYKTKFVEPDAKFDYYTTDENGDKIDPQGSKTFYTNIAITIENTGVGNDFTVYSGAPGFDFYNSAMAVELGTISQEELEIEKNTVKNRDKGSSLTISPEDNKYRGTLKYGKAGIYKIHYIATAYANNVDDYGYDIDSSLTLEIIDSLAYFKSFALSDFAAITVDEYWDGSNHRIDYKVAPGSSVSTANIAFAVYDKSTVVKVNGAEISTGSSFDFSNPITFELTTPSDITRTTIVTIIEI